MLTQKQALNPYHQATKHSYLSVQIDPNYIDTSTQPSPFKTYPKFYRRFPLCDEQPFHSFLKLTHTITFEKNYREGPYQLRVNPSAGALYPTELYVQSRGVPGLIDGIYHVEVATNSLTLIYELIDDGIESYVLRNHVVKGFIFLVSCVYFRSSWKYKNRSIRYCLLDSGHHLGAIEASAYLHNQQMQIIFDFDKLGLNEALGFANQEFATVCAIAGEVKEKIVRRLRSQLPFVCGTDYFEANSFVTEAYHNTLSQRRETPQLFKLPFGFQAHKFLESILLRRSARRFHRQSISAEDLMVILEVLEQPIPSQSDGTIELYLVLNRVEDMASGVYRKIYLSEKMLLIKAGDYSNKVGYLCINQAIARDSAVTLFMVSDDQNYQTALQLAGFIGQRLYLISQYLGIGCSGIGAFFDDEIQDFLGTDRDVLYAMAIGL